MTCNNIDSHKTIAKVDIETLKKGNHMRSNEFDLGIGLWAITAE